MCHTTSTTARRLTTFMVVYRVMSIKRPSLLTHTLPSTARRLARTVYSNHAVSVTVIL